MLIQQYNRFLYGQIPGGGGYSETFIHTLAWVISFFLGGGGSKFCSSIFFFCGGGGGSEKLMSFKLGYEDFVDIFRGHHKIGLYLVVISMHFRVFS